VSSSVGLSGYLDHEDGGSVPGPRCGYMRFGAFYVAETGSRSPECIARLLRYLQRKGRSREDAEDLIQEAMLRLHVYAHNVAIEDDEAFLRRAVHNLAVDQYRRDRPLLRRVLPIEEAR
jgi:hypothetical protein